MYKILMKNILIFPIVFLFVSLSFIPMVIGNTNEVKAEEDYFENIAFVSYDEYDNLNFNDYREVNKVERIEGNKSFDMTVSKNTFQILPLDGPMDSPWPIKCHDNRHTSQSPYSTVDNPFDEIWNFRTTNHIRSGIVIDNDDTIYFGSFDFYLHALNQNGTEKWRYKTDMWVWSTPAIDEDGTIYVSSYDDYLHAVNPDGTKKWKFEVGGAITTSPAIGVNGTIYFGEMGHGNHIFAVNPNGTEKWRYPTGYYITSDPAIGDDGTIYIGSGDDYFYAMNPNGTLKWRYKTGDIIKGPASIAHDGTIYVGSWDDYLYAMNPNGTMKWRHQIDSGTESNPSIGSDGTIYCGGRYLYAINPDGTRKWTFDFGEDRHSHQSSPAISADGTIFIGVIIGDDDGGEILAVNPDGTEQWREYIAENQVQSSPCIGSDGTVYVGSASTASTGNDYGYLHAFGEWDPTAPLAPTITGETQGHYGEEYEYTFVSTDPENQDIRYYIDWGDGSYEDWIGPYSSGQEITVCHIWDEENTYTIRAKAKDTLDVESPWGTLEVTMPLNQQVRSQNSWFLQFLQNHPNMFPKLRQILGF